MRRRSPNASRCQCGYWLVAMTDVQCFYAASRQYLTRVFNSSICGRDGFALQVSWRSLAEFLEFVSNTDGTETAGELANRTVRV